MRYFFAIALMLVSIHTSAGAPPNEIWVTGSDSLQDAFTIWRDAYQAENKLISIQLHTISTNDKLVLKTLKGDFYICAMIRPASEKTLMLADTDALCLRIASNAFYIYVHPENPALGISLEQLCRMYARDPGRDLLAQDGQVLSKAIGLPIDKWKQLDLPKLALEWQDRPVRCLGLVQTSAAARIFSELAMGGRPFREEFQFLPGTSAIVHEVNNDDQAIGFARTGFLPANIRILPVSVLKGQPLIVPGLDTIRDESYPLAHACYVYVKKNPDEKVRKFLEFILSAKGQNLLIENRSQFTPLSDERRAAELKKLEK